MRRKNSNNAIDKKLQKQYKQRYKKAIEQFKNCSYEEILRQCLLKDDNYTISLEKYDSGKHNSKEKLKLEFDRTEAQAYIDAGQYLMKMGTVN